MIAYFFFGQLAVMAIWASIAWALDAFGRRPHDDGPFDAIIVPGCAVRSDGTPSGALARRTRHAVDLYQSGLAPSIVLTGGVGRFPPSEAASAAEMATNLGVPQAALILEEASTSTIENAAFAAKCLGDASQRRVLIATDGYHCWRCRRIFRGHFKAVSTAGSVPGPRLRVRGAMREVISILKLLLSFH